MKEKELIETLRVCTYGGVICPACPRYNSSVGMAQCYEKLVLEAADTIESQQKRISELESMIREQEERENQEPLTMEDLRQMDAPVWCLCKPIEGGNGFWCLCKKGEIIPPSGVCYDVKEIPHWVFLRNKPKE